ncbi:hypothetical protein QDY65_00180 [Pyrococcus kukulkanii]|uniref:hypothetical protein n=1 Tax=Pyrococcus kukulkanii TaxID=1609559 RepID=UPI003561DB7F
MSRSAQTAVEMLVLVGVIIAGIVIVVPAYLDNNSKVSLTSAVRDAADFAANYVSLGVEGKDYPDLNDAIRALNYQPDGIRFIGLNVKEEGNVTIVTLKFECLVECDEARVGSDLGQSIKSYLAHNNGEFSIRNGTLIFNNQEIWFNVTVNSVWVVVR